MQKKLSSQTMKKAKQAKKLANKKRQSKTKTKENKNTSHGISKILGISQRVVTLSLLCWLVAVVAVAIFYVSAR